LLGAVLISLLGGMLHFTFELSGFQPLVGVFSAVNESVWEHLKLGFWPSVLYLLVEHRLIRSEVHNFLAKAVVPYTVVVVVPAIFYGYTSVTGESILLVDIASFFAAVAIGQALSYKLLTRKPLPKNVEKLAVAALITLGAAFTAFTFIPPHLPPFQDAVTGEYGIVQHMH